MAKTTASNSSLEKVHLMSYSQNQKTTTKISQEDSDAWKAYIEHIYSQPESKFVPKKKPVQNRKTSLDLHNMTIQQAFNSVRMFVEENHAEGERTLVIITGKSGKIADEFSAWCSNIPLILKIDPVMDSRGECGAWIITLRRS